MSSYCSFAPIRPISDQYAPYHIKAITSTIRDATHVLDGLLYHESELRIEEHYIDTNGFTDHIFGLCPPLGYRFAPRIRDLKDKNLYVPDDPKNYPALSNFLGDKIINQKIIRSQWSEYLHLATSIKQGTVTASLMLRKLASYPRQNGLARALREIGRIERTIFALDWLLDPRLRQRVTAGLNKGESKNTLARAVCFGGVSRNPRFFRRQKLSPAEQPDTIRSQLTIRGYMPVQRLPGYPQFLA